VFARNFTMWSGFTALVGADELSTAATAVAGPSAPIGPGEACDLAPMLVCGDPDAGAAGNWGYTGTNVTLLKMASNTTSAVGPGNFQLVRLGGAGADVVRENLAGGYGACLESTSSAETQPGNETGPVAQGLNTRFGRYLGGMREADYPPDKITTEPSPGLCVGADDSTVLVRQGPGHGNCIGTPVANISEVTYSYSNYQGDMQAPSFPSLPGVARRRVIAVPIANCSSMINGQGTLPVLGFGCFFLLQQVEQRGNESFVYSQFIGQCAAGGAPGPVPGPVGGSGIYKIVLHNDPASPDS